MADTETTKQATDWLTLEELSARWERSIERILGYEAQGRLRIAARTGFYEKSRRETRSFVFTKDGKTVTTTKEEGDRNDYAQALYYPPKGKASLLACDDAVVRVAGLKKDDFFGLTSYKLENDPPFSPLDITLKREALRVSIEEVQRFEREEMNTAPDAAPEINRPWAHLVNSENKKTSALYKQEATRIRGEPDIPRTASMGA